MGSIAISRISKVRYKNHYSVHGVVNDQVYSLELGRVQKTDAKPYRWCFQLIDIVGQKHLNVLNIQWEVESPHFPEQGDFKTRKEAVEALKEAYRRRYIEAIPGLTIYLPQYRIAELHKKPFEIVHFEGLYFLYAKSVGYKDLIASCGVPKTLRQIASAFNLGKEQ